LSPDGFYSSAHLANRRKGEQHNGPTYIAFLSSFCYVSVIWLNHRAVFARVCYCDRSLRLANLFLLLTPALIPFPTRCAVRGHPKWH
jgi:uncharacterized membrane protein